MPSTTAPAADTPIAQLAAEHDIVGLNESDAGSLRSGFTNQTHYLAERGGFNFWSHQPNRSVGGVASSANGLLSKLELESRTQAALYALRHGLARLE